MFKKAVLIAVLLVAFGFGTAFAAQIDDLASINGPGAPFNVFVNPGGLGDALIYGYYNVRDGNDTFFTVTNTDSDFGARVRIRFREAATLGPDICNGSQEVLDFDICLSPNDVWSGQITTDGGTGAAVLLSADDDTFIAPADKVFPDQFPTGALFAFGAGNLDITADQTREGYFEVIAEQQLVDSSSCSTASGCGIGNALPCCTCGNMLDTDGGFPGDGNDVDNVLMGHVVIVNLDTTSTFSYAATALADFAFVDITNGITTARPNLRDDSEDGTIIPVNFALTKDNLMAVYDLESGIGGRTELIVNFPTKHLTHDESVVSVECVIDGNDNLDIFDDPRVNVTIFDDEEHSVTAECIVSPCAVGQAVSLPHEVNLVKINSGSDIFTSDVETLLATTFQFGWIKVNLVESNDPINPPDPAHVVDSGLGQAKEGLPAIGYAVLDFAGGAFSGLIPLQYTNSVFFP